MDYEELPEHPKQKQFDLIFGLIFFVVGFFHVIEMYRGVAYSKLKIIMNVFMLVLGVFKLYAYLKTRTVKN